MSGHQEEQQAAGPDELALAPLERALRRLGYEVEPPRPGAPRGSELIARRDLGNRVILLVVDRAGRFRIELTWQAGERPSRQTLGGMPVRVVESVTRAVTVAGQIDEAERLLDVVAELGRLVPWAGATSDVAEDLPGPESGPHLPPPP